MTSMKSPDYMGAGMYRENIIDHYKHPRNKEELESFDFDFRDSNPTCGDVIEWKAVVDGDKLEELKFQGHGCAISQAAASMLSQLVEGKKLDEVLNMDNEDVFEMLGIELSALRVKCALLGLKALQKGILKYKAGDVE